MTTPHWYFIDAEGYLEGDTSPFEVEFGYGRGPDGWAQANTYSNLQVQKRSDAVRVVALLNELAVGPDPDSQPVQGWQELPEYNTEGEVEVPAELPDGFTPATKASFR